MIKVMVPVLMVLSTSACVSVTSDGRCEEQLGNTLFARSEYAAAFSALEGCEEKEDASGLALGQLAWLYIQGYSDIEAEAELFSKSYELIYRGAKKGDVKVTGVLASIYRNGEPVLAIIPDREIAVCLTKLAETERISGSDIDACLKE